MNIEPATGEQIDEIYQLVNIAYRGTEGWTRETDMVSGQRASRAEIESMIRHPEAHLLVYRREGKVLACIAIEHKGTEAKLGLFAVAPSAQGQGLGKTVLTLAEAYAAKQLGAKRAVMLVVSQRHELIAYYQRRGYLRTGRLESYPMHLDVGTPIMDGLTIETLHKTLA